MVDLSKKVLMLGWEFPPFVSGGLARATFGLVKSLSSKTDITLIVPFKEAGYKMDNVTLIGCNLLDEINSTTNQTFFKDDLNIPEIFERFLSSYPSEYNTSIEPIIKTSSNIEEKNSSLSVDLKINTEPINQVFSGKELYGPKLHLQKEMYIWIAEKIATSCNFDIIHAHDWITFEAGMNIKIITHKPLVLHVHSLEVDRINEHIRNDVFYIEKKAMEMADAIIPVSEYTRQRISRIYEINSEKVFPVHNGISPHDIKRWRHVIKKKIVAFVGRITTQKGPLIFAKTAEALIKKDKDVIFVVAGKGDKLNELIDYVAAHNLSRYFMFTGFLSREDVNALLATADVYFMPSISEPFGLSALEAVQAGTPCVLSKQSGVSEVLPDAPVADFWDVELFAKHIHTILSDKKIADELGRKNMQRLKDLNWDAAALKVFSIYDWLINSKNTSQ